MTSAVPSIKVEETSVTTTGQITEPVLPGMPEPEPLWAVHVQGPDDVIAATCKEAAERYAQGLNDWYQARTQEPDFDPETFPRVHAEVVPWPYGRQAHTEALREQAEERVLPALTEQPDLPDLEGFTTCHGVKVSPIGDDGTLIVLGHHDRRRVIAALNAYSRDMCGFANVLDEPGAGFEEAQEFLYAAWAVLVTSCDKPAGHDTAECGKCKEIAEGPWWIRYDAKETHPGAFPVMIWDR